MHRRRKTKWEESRKRNGKTERKEEGMQAKLIKKLILLRLSGPPYGLGAPPYALIVPTECPYAL